MRILLVEDDAQVSQVLVATLTRQNHVVDVAIDAEEGWSLMRVFPYDLALLDVVLPSLDGISFCRRLRQSNKDILIMLITAKSDQASRILGLDAGADDYMIKPFDPAELAARVRALQRRGSSSSPVLEFGNLRLDPARREVTYADQVLNFRPKEYALLELLLRHPNRVFNRREILDRLWSAEAEPPNEATIKAHIKGIRHVLRTVGAEDLIRTVYGQGYHLNANFLAIEPPQIVNTEAIVSDIWEQVKELSFERLAVLQQAVRAIAAGTLSDSLREEALRNAHRLVGALGMFGFTEGSALARQLEMLLESNALFDQSQFQQAEQLLSNLEQQLKKERRSQVVQKNHAGDTDAGQLPTKPSKVKVLAIDDDAILLKLLQELMLPFGVEIVPLTSPSLLWQYLSHVQPDLILLDVMMPEVNGVEVCKSIRMNAQWQWLPIVFLTVCQDADTQVRVFEVGADDYLWKPFASSVLATRILNRVSRFKAIQEHAIEQLTEL